MNTPARFYSAFPALLIFFAAVAVMDVDQMMTLRQKKRAVMQSYAQALTLQKQVAAETKWVASLRQDLLRLAPGDAEAAAVVSELGLKPRAAH